VKKDDGKFLNLSSQDDKISSANFHTIGLRTLDEAQGDFKLINGSIHQSKLKDPKNPSFKK
jgi:hypothetical protein